MMQNKTYYFITLCSYFVGALPTGYWYAKYLYNIDITQTGSTNIGASNCGRILKSLKHFFIVMILDATKSFSVLSAVAYISPGNMQLLVLSASSLLIGNSFSCFLQGKGGKGVSTFLGIIAALDPSSLLLLIPTWTFIKLTTKSSALASTCTVSVLPIYYFYCTSAPNNLLAFFFASAACWIILRHKNNFYQYLKTR